MIRAEYKNNRMYLAISGSVTDITIELDNLLHQFIETQPEIVNGCLSYEADNISKSLKRCDVMKVKAVEVILGSAIKIEEGEIHDKDSFSNKGH